MDAPALTTDESARPDDRASVTLRMFAAARQEAGTGSAAMRAATVGQVIDDAVARYGATWAQIAATSRLWVNGEPADATRVLSDGDEVAVLPPVSGGMG